MPWSLNGELHVLWLLRVFLRAFVHQRRGIILGAMQNREGRVSFYLHHGLSIQYNKNCRSHNLFNYTYIGSQVFGLRGGDCLCWLGLHPSLSLLTWKADSPIDQQPNWKLSCYKMKAVDAKEVEAFWVNNDKTDKYEVSKYRYECCLSRTRLRTLEWRSLGSSVIKVAAGPRVSSTP